jgi:hypothetical protein
MSEPGDAVRAVSVLVDVANVMGSRPDGWWRDRAGAATALLASLAGLPGARLTGPDGTPLLVAEVVAVLEGAARRAQSPQGRGLRVVLAQADGDSAVVACAEELLGAGAIPVVVTADRGLRSRIRAGCAIAGPRWLLTAIGRTG